MLPEGFESLKNLEVLNISGNSVKQLPPLQSIPSIRILDYSLSRLSLIPEECCTIIQLRELKLMNNQITKIPDSITRLTNLEVLELKHNKIDKIPDFINKLVALKVLTIDHNQIEELPESVQFFSYLFFPFSYYLQFFFSGLVVDF